MTAVYFTFNLFIFGIAFGIAFGINALFKLTDIKTLVIICLSITYFMSIIEISSMDENHEELNEKAKSEIEKIRNEKLSLEKELKEKINSLNYAEKALKKRRDYLSDAQKYFDDVRQKLNQDLDDVTQKLRNSEATVEFLQKKYDDFINTSPLKTVAKFYADYTMFIHAIDNKNLIDKDRPAFKAAEAMKLQREHAKEEITRLKESEYKLEFLLDAFPELRIYLNSFSDLNAICSYDNFNDFEENRDRAQDYLEKEEYEKLSVSERNQLALDRYIERQKSNWQIGRDFEMFCAWYLEQEGYSVERYGIEKGVNDLGRDLIATCSFMSDRKILIIQCKCWNKDREIRENVISQLYGTYFAYIHENEENIKKDNIEVIPVIMFPQFSRLSDVAKEFCEKLNVRIKQLDYKDFPRIKCNINGTNKIYHLPFDQQYDRTKICKPGEFYAYKVKEAEDAGFRRAFPHRFISE